MVHGFPSWQVNAFISQGATAELKKKYNLIEVASVANLNDDCE